MCLRATHACATKTGMCGRPGSSARGIGRTVQHVFLRARIEGKPRQALRGQAERACARRGLDLVQSPADLVVRKRAIAEASDQPAPRYGAAIRRHLIQTRDQTLPARPRDSYM
jgi:hypothetical protein